MGWPWSRKQFSATVPSVPKPDPIGDICRSLAEKPWEWQVGKSARDRPLLEHVSGVFIVYRYDATYGTVEAWMGNGGTQTTALPTRDAWRLFQAIQANAAARVSKPHPTYSFPKAAKTMAAAVNADDMHAAKALADLICELSSEVPT